MKLVGKVCLLLLATTLLGAPSDREIDNRELPLKNWLPALWTPARADSPASEGNVAATALPSSASHFIALNPCRVVDTRRPDGAHGGPILTGGVSRAFNIPSGPCPGIPAASAYSFNIAVTGSAPGSAQFLTAWPTGTSRPVIATMNFNGGQTVSNAALVPADGTGSVDLYVSASSHVIIDINGYIKEGVVTSVMTGSGLYGGGTGTVAVGISEGGIAGAHLGPSAVTTGAIADAAVTGAKLANDHIVRDVNLIKDSVTITGAGSASVSTIGSTITVTGFTEVPSGSAILGIAGDTTLIGAGYSEVGPSKEDLWSATATSGAPSGRWYHTAVWTGTEMIVWGGYDGTAANTGGRYDPATNSWTATTTSQAPSGRWYHTAVWTGTKMIVWGGAGGDNTGGLYDPVADVWTATNTAGAPAARQSHTAIWTGNRMVVWSGSNGSEALETGGLFDPVANLWSATSLTNAPSAREFHTAVWTGTKMIVWGGYPADPSGGQYDPVTNVWTATATAGAPTARYFHTAVWTGTKMIVWGGYSDGAATNTGGRYDPAANSWVATSPDGAPSGRELHTAIWTGSRMVVWGGDDIFITSFSTGGQYDPVANSWTSMSTAGAPAARNLYTAIWTGKSMIVWGGQPQGGGVLDTGGRWTPLSLYVKN